MVGTRLMSVARCSSISLYTLSGIEATHHDLFDAHHRGGVRVTPSVGVKQRDRVQVYHVKGLDVAGGDGYPVKVDRPVRQA